MARDHLISVRVDEYTKQRFRELAAHQGLSESTLLKRLLDLALVGAADRVVADTTVTTASRDARLYVRLSPADRRLLAERAGRRELRAATYVSLLIRAHLLGAAPLPAAELGALKQSVAELSAVGRNLNQFVRAVQAGRQATGFTVEHAKALIRVCEALHDRTKEMISANVRSWQGGDPHG